MTVHRVAEGYASSMERSCSVGQPAVTPPPLSGAGLRRYLRSRAYNSARSAWRSVKKARLLLHLVQDCRYDLSRYFKWSHGVGNDFSRSQRERALLKHYHGLEKGLSLAEPRPGFGEDKARALTRRIDEWRALYGMTGPAVAATDCLRSYHAFNVAAGKTQVWLEAWLSAVGEVGGNGETGGTMQLGRDEIHAAVAKGGASFFASRHSIRQFAPEPVPLEDIERAVAMAQKTPSVCNRQGGKAYCFQDAKEALKWQPGNSGFGHLASRALVVTADLQAFSGAGERNQCWIDGGMFAMSIVYALHSLGYGTCTLAWSMRPREDRRMREALGIPSSEAVIMMIAVGRLPHRFAVARSQRTGLDGCLVLR